jgi:hypothetical protein
VGGIKAENTQPPHGNPAGKKKQEAMFPIRNLTSLEEVRESRKSCPFYRLANNLR